MQMLVHPLSPKLVICNHTFNVRPLAFVRNHREACIWPKSLLQLRKHLSKEPSKVFTCNICWLPCVGYAIQAKSILRDKIHPSHVNIRKASPLQIHLLECLLQILQGLNSFLQSLLQKRHGETLPRRETTQPPACLQSRPGGFCQHSWRAHTWRRSVAIFACSFDSKSSD